MSVVVMLFVSVPLMLSVPAVVKLLFGSNIVMLL